MSDMMTMPVRQLITDLRKQASELNDENLIRVLFVNTMINRLEQEADRADAAEKEERHWRHECRLETDKVNALLECKPDAEQLEIIADTLRSIGAPNDYVTTLNLWADATRKADRLLGASNASG